ncbi:MAG: UDP-N-acetylmuramoyl-tripeptide--D-alanyl-D-alanine ligase [Polyangiaceae bacterium]
MATPIPENRASFDAPAAAAATGGRLVRASQPVRRVLGVTTDSRAVTPGCAFVCIRGERHDGHEYIDAAIAAGATLVVVERGRAPADPRVDVVEVDDTLVAWGAIAGAHLREWRRSSPEARVVAITGSAGKTTTKELCAALLRAVAACHATSGNLNNRVGMPAVVLGLEPHHRFAVLELGMSVPGEIAALAAIADPDVAVVTNVGLAHAGGVGGTLEDVGREKGALFAHLGPEGVAVANADDPAVVAQTRRAQSARSVLFGRSERSDVRLVRRKPLGAEGSRVYVRRADRESAFVLPIPGEVAAIDFTAALAAAEAALGVTLDDARIASALRTLPPIAGRMQVRRLQNDILVIDDAYNANPASVRAALSALGEIAGARRVAVLGEMKELGPEAEREHERLGEAVASAGVALLVSCGGLADLTVRTAKGGGVEAFCAKDAAEAALVCAEHVRTGDRVLVKASRSVGAERVVDALVRAYGEELR